MPDVLTDGEVYLNGRRYAIDGSVAVVAVNQFPGKVVTGDTNRDVEPVASTHIWSDWRGGLGIEVMDPSAHKDRFWYSTLDTRFKDQLFLPPEYLVAHGGGTAPTSRIRAVATYGAILFAAFNNNDVYSYNGTIWTDTTHNVAGTAWDALTIRQGATNWFVIGTTAGVTKYDGATWSNTSGGTVPASAYGLVVHNGFLWAMDGNGTVHKCTDLSANTWDAGGTMPAPDHVTPPFRQLLVFPNIAGDPTIHCVSRTGLWAYDELNEIWYATQLQWPYQAEGGGQFIGGATVWRGDLYIAVGIDIFKYNGGVVSNIGLNRDDGLSASYSASFSPVRFLVNAYNWLAAATTDTVFLWDGVGWHYQMTAGPGVNGGLSAMHFYSSMATGTASLLTSMNFDGGSALRATTLPIALFNPRRLTTSTYAQSGTHITGWFDADWKELTKTAIEVAVEGTGITTDELITVGYQINSGTESSGSTSLGTMTANGPTTYQFASGAGVTFYRIRFFLGMQRSTATATPTLYYLRLKYLKNLPPRLGYNFTVHIHDTQDGRTPSAQWFDLLATYSTETLVDLSFRRTSQELVSRKVKLTRWSGPAFTGTNTRGKIQISCVEV
jgi:hypothetical protein